MTFTNLVIGLIAFVLLIIVLMQISKVAELLRSSRKDQEKAEQDSSRSLARIFLSVGIIGTILIIWSYFSQSHKYLPEAASELGRAWHNIFYKVFTPPIMIVFFITQGLLFYFAYKYRYKKGRKVEYFSHSNRLEMIWTSVPLITMIVFGAITIPKWVQATSAPSENAMHIRITGMQFKWFMAYPGKDGEFGERKVRQYGNIQNLLGLNPYDEKGYDDVYVDELVVPVNQEISFDLEALDVIHDFYLPHFRMKMDCVPGVPTRLKIIPDITTEEMRTKTGNPDFNYEIACAELCGTGHWNMRRVIKVVSQDEFDRWLNEQMLAKDLYYNTILEDVQKKDSYDMEGAREQVEMEAQEEINESEINHDGMTDDHSKEDELINHDDSSSH